MKSVKIFLNLFKNLWNSIEPSEYIEDDVDCDDTDDSNSNKYSDFVIYSNLMNRK